MFLVQQQAFNMSNLIGDGLFDELLCSQDFEVGSQAVWSFKHHLDLGLSDC